jgi:hypothetical protein
MNLVNMLMIAICLAPVTAAVWVGITMWEK